MIKLSFKSTKDRLNAYKAMRCVADDVLLFHKELNKLNRTDINLPCPDGNEKESGIVNDTILWFGDNSKRCSTMDVNVAKGKERVLTPKSKHLKLLFQLTCLSLCEQFVYTKFHTNENFGVAIAMYEDYVGSISHNACKSLGIPEKI